MKTVTVRITERPDAPALHAQLDALGRNQVRWPSALPGDLLVEIAEAADDDEVRAAVLSTAPTPPEPADARRRRLVIESLSKADLVRAILDTDYREQLRSRLA